MIAGALKSPVVLGALALAAAVVVIAAASRARRPGADSWAMDAGRAAGGAVVTGASDAFGGFVRGAASAVGVPDTDPGECARALADGRLWDASFSCPALEFIRGAFGITPDEAPTLDRPGALGGYGVTGEW